MRKTARLLLKHRWLSASLTTLVALISVAVLPLPYLFFSDKISLIISTLLSLFATAPILIGYKRWCAKLEFDTKPKFLEIFFFFTTPKRYLKSTLTATTLFVRTIFLVLCTMLPTLSLLFLVDWLKLQPQNDIVDIFVKNCTFLAIAGGLVFLILLIVSLAKASATSYFVAVDESVSVRKAVKLSAKLFREKGGYLLKTLLLLVPLSVFILPLFITIPYFVVLTTQCAKNSLKQ